MLFETLERFIVRWNFIILHWLKIVLVEIWWEGETKENKSTEIQTKNDKTMRCGCDVYRLFTCYYLFVACFIHFRAFFVCFNFSLMNVLIVWPGDLIGFNPFFPYFIGVTVGIEGLKKVGPMFTFDKNSTKHSYHNTTNWLYC